MTFLNALMEWSFAIMTTFGIFSSVGLPGCSNQGIYELSIHHRFTKSWLSGVLKSKMATSGMSKNRQEHSKWRVYGKSMMHICRKLMFSCILKFKMATSGSSKNQPNYSKWRVYVSSAKHTYRKSLSGVVLKSKIATYSSLTSNKP